jgi:RNA polymerase sigma factor (sigma-70 family)
MINKFINTAIMKFGDKIEKADMLQEMRVETWRAFEMYDGEHAFSTILVNRLKKVTGNAAHKITAKKRANFGTLSMNASVGDTEDLTLEDMFAEEDYAAEQMIASEMMQTILPQLNEREKEEMLCILYPNEYNSSKLAKKLGISRPAAHQRIVKLKTKLQQILIANEFVLV